MVKAFCQPHVLEVSAIDFGGISRSCKFPSPVLPPIPCLWMMVKCGAELPAESSTSAGWQGRLESPASGETYEVHRGQCVMDEDEELWTEGA